MFFQGCIKSWFQPAAFGNSRDLELTFKIRQMHHQCPKNWLILTYIDMYLPNSRKNIDVFEHWSTLNCPIFHGYFYPFSQTIFGINGPEAWTMHEEGSVLEPCIRRCPEDETTRAMETRNGFILEGKSPEPWRHWYPTSHSPATYLTHKLTSFKAIEIDMGLCQFFDTIPASVDETVDKFLHLLIGPCPSRCYIAMENHHL